MMPQDDMKQMPHDDASEDASMIAQVLRKVADDMEGYEANRIHPKMVAKVDVMAPKPEEPAMPEDQEPDMDDNGLDPEILKQLMDKAGQADDSGALPEDQESDLPPEVAMAVKKKKGLLK